MMLNTYILYKINTKENRLPRVKFITSIIENIPPEWFAIKEAVDIGGAGDDQGSNFGLRKLPEKKENLQNLFW